MQHFAVISSLLFFISISNKFISLLVKVAGGKLPFNMIFKIILLSSPEILSLLMPLSLFIAILFVVSKLYADNEIVTLFSSGLDWSFLIKTISTISIFIAIITGIITLWISPSLVKIRETMLSKGEAIGAAHAVTPGHFHIINDGKQVFYVGDIDENDTVKDVFIATNHSNKVDNFLITAQSGQIKHLSEQEGNMLILHNGQRYVSSAEGKDFSVINFAEYGRQLLPKSGAVTSLERVKDTKDIYKSTRPEEMAEYTWRLAMPISVLVLTILAVGLAKVSPRQGRFAKFFPAILLYILYCNGMLFMRRLIACNVVDNYVLGLWLVHGIFLIVSWVLVLQASGWFVYIKNKLFKLR